jgi:hypothetical protein
MYLHPLRARPAEPGIPGNSDVDEGRVGVGNSVHGESCGVRKCDILWTVVSLGPEHSLPVLGESIRRKVGDTVYAASGPLQTATLGEACQH